MDQDFKRYLENEIYNIKEAVKNCLADTPHLISGTYNDLPKMGRYLEDNLKDVLQAISNIEHRIELESKKNPEI